MSDGFDLVIRGGIVYDGTGAPGQGADVAIRGDRVLRVGQVRERGGREIDARGLSVAPGFVDVHSHDDLAVLLDPGVAFKVRQGVTLDIVGNCGSGIAPYAVGLARFRRFHPGADPPPWEGYAGYMRRVEETGPALNVAVLAGHGSLRQAVMDLDQRPPTDAELGAMRDLLDEALAAGVVGLSTGLVYEPGRFAATDEIIALARMLAGTGGVYTSHIRNEAAFLLDAVGEAIRIGEEAGVPVEISHHKAAGRNNHGRVRQSLGLIEAARDRGLDVTADQYPYTAGSTYLAAVMANRALQPDTTGGMGHLLPEDIRVASAPSQPEAEGSTLAQLAERWRLPAEQVAARLLDADGDGVVVVTFMMAEVDVRTVLAHPTTMIGSDGIPAVGARPHPRLYGTFPRVLGEYVREQRVLDLPTAIHRMTGLPAAKFGLTDRGVLRPGAFADLVLFDAAVVRDVGTYEDPRRHPAGIEAVVVNGRPVVESGAPTAARPGQVVLGSGWRPRAGGAA
jgi:N-acyl-D-amino-acid deacylase